MVLSSPYRYAFAYKKTPAAKKLPLFFRKKCKKRYQTKFDNNFLSFFIIIFVI